LQLASEVTWEEQIFPWASSAFHPCKWSETAWAFPFWESVFPTRGWISPVIAFLLPTPKAARPHSLGWKGRWSCSGICLLGRGVMNTELAGCCRVCFSPSQLAWLLPGSDCFAIFCQRGLSLAAAAQLPGGLPSALGWRRGRWCWGEKPGQFHSPALVRAGRWGL